MSTPLFVIINGYLQEDNLGVSTVDRGLAYGDGVFETIRVDQGEAILWSYHQERLYKGLQRLAINVSESNFDAHWQKTLSQLASLSAECKPSGICKLIVTRGSGGRGYMPPEPAEPTLISQFFPFTDTWLQENTQHTDNGVSVHWCQERLPIAPSLAGIKSLNQLHYVLATHERKNSLASEGLLLDSHEQVIEATARNLFIVKNNRIYTPPLEQCGVAGVMRQVIIDAVQQVYPVMINNLQQQHINDADEVFLSNSVTGIWPVTECEGFTWPVGQVTQHVQTLVMAYIQNMQTGE